MDRDALLAAFDAQIRRAAGGPRPHEHDDGVVRAVSDPDGWSGVTWSDLGAATPTRSSPPRSPGSRTSPRPWEWKHYSYDRPPTCPGGCSRPGSRRAGRGAARRRDRRPRARHAPARRASSCGRSSTRPASTRSCRCTTRCSARTMPASAGRCWRGLRREPARWRAWSPSPAETPISAARVEFHAGTDFASLWGGGTLPAWRRRGVFRALVAYRAAPGGGARVPLPPGRRAARRAARSWSGWASSSSRRRRRSCIPARASEPAGAYGGSGTGARRRRAASGLRRRSRAPRRNRARPGSAH